MTGLSKYRNQLIEGLQALDFDHISKATDVIFGAWQRGSSVYIFGNGHSASTSEAFAADLRKWPQTENSRGVKAHALTLLPLMTAYANDNSYSVMFREQLQDVIDKGDVSIGITCGGSSNVIRALAYAWNYGPQIIITANKELMTKKYSAKVFVSAPDIRQQEDIMGAVCHMIVGEVKARIEEHLEGD